MDGVLVDLGVVRNRQGILRLGAGLVVRVRCVREEPGGFARETGDDRVGQQPDAREVNLRKKDFEEVDYVLQIEI
jgi:hypothetical protein